MEAELLQQIAEYAGARFLEKSAERAVPAHGFYPVKKSTASQDGTPVEKGWDKRRVIVGNHYPVRPKPGINPHTGLRIKKGPSGGSRG